MRNIFLSVIIIVFVKVCIFSLNMRDIIIYFARWWEKYLSKCSPLKHTCSWRDKLIVSGKQFFKIQCNGTWKVETFIVYYLSQFCARKYLWFPGMTYEFGNDLLQKKWSLPLRVFLTFCAATIFTFEIFVIKKDYWTMVHSTSLYICQQIYHSVVKNGRVLFFSAYGSKNKSVKHYNTDYFWKISSSYVTSVWITTLEISNFTIFVYWLNT